MKEPARLWKQQESDVSPLFSSWLFLHPAAIILAVIIGIVLLSSLAFALHGGSAVDSGELRNFLVNGV